MLPKTTTGASEMMAPRVRGGIGKVDPRNPADLVVSVQGIEMSLGACCAIAFYGCGVSRGTTVPVLTSSG